VRSPVPAAETVVVELPGPIVGKSMERKGRSIKKFSQEFGDSFRARLAQGSLAISRDGAFPGGRERVSKGLL